MRTHTKGLLITALGVFILGPDTLFIRLIDEDLWMVLAWRGLLTIIGFSLLAKWFGHTPISQLHRRISKAELLLAICFCFSSICFINSINLTTVAHTLVIISAAPMIAAAISALVFKQSISRSSILAMVLVLGGVVLVVENQGEGHWLGDLLAFFTAALLALTFVISNVNQNLHRFPAMALSGVFIVLVSLFFVDPMALKPTSIPYILILGCITTSAFALLVIGPRYLPAHEVGLMMPLETVLGVLLVWWFLDEVPSLQTLLGGFIVLATLAIYSLHKARSG